MRRSKGPFWCNASSFALASVAGRAGQQQQNVSMAAKNAQDGALECRRSEPACIFIAVERSGVSMERRGKMAPAKSVRPRVPGEARFRVPDGIMPCDKGELS